VRENGGQDFSPCCSIFQQSAISKALSAYTNIVKNTVVVKTIEVDSELRNRCEKVVERGKVVELIFYVSVDPILRVSASSDY
jgi:hypothetical protein